MIKVLVGEERRMVLSVQVSGPAVPGSFQDSSSLSLQAPTRLFVRLSLSTPTLDVCLLAFPTQFIDALIFSLIAA